MCSLCQSTTLTSVTLMEAEAPAFPSSCLLWLLLLWLLLLFLLNLIFFISPVRLVAGDHSHGIVKFWNGAVWYVLCGSQFSDDDAGVVCRQLGFKHGVKLPMASYGTYFSMTYGRSVDCVGNETSIMDCPVFSYKCAKTYNTEYAAVSCSDKPFTNGENFCLLTTREWILLPSSVLC